MSAKKRRVLKIDLPDFIEARGVVSIGERGSKSGGGVGQEVSDAQLVDLERILHRELASGDVQVSPATIRKAYGLKVDNFLAFLRRGCAGDATTPTRFASSAPAGSVPQKTQAG